MKRLILLTIILTAGAVTGRIAAQDAASVSKRANQQYVLFESERDKGTNITAMYDYLLESYVNFIKIVEAPDNGQYLEGAKNRLRSLYPYLLNGAVYYSEQKQPAKALDFASAYIDMPQLAIFRSELLPKDNRYASVVYYAAVSAYNLQKNELALKYFQEYLNTGTEAQEKDCYVYMNMIYQSQKKYADQERILLKANEKYPVSLDFLYNLVNVYIATNDMEKLLGAIDRILAVDPNNDKVLPIKARILERQGKNIEALDIYKRLYALYPNNFELMTGVARANFNCATEIVNNGATIANDTEYALIRQRASGYLLDAKDLFLKILEKEPSSKMYMQGLAGVYQYMDMKAEYEVLNKIIEDGASYTLFPDRLLAYNESLKKTENVAQEQSSVPVPVDPAMLVIRVDSFIDGNNNKVIDAGESFAVQFTVENQGKGDAYNIRLRLSEQQGYDRYFDGPRELDGGNIPAGTSKEYTFRYIVKQEMPTALARINIYAFEANGFDADPSELIVNTMEYSMPRLRIADHQFFASEGSSITIGKNGKLTVAVQNFGTKTAHNVKLNFTLPKNVYTTDSPEMTIDSIAPGDVATLDYGFLVNKRFDGDSIAVVLAVTESTRSSAINEAYKVKVGEYLTAASTMNLSGNVVTRRVVAKDFSLTFKSELMEDIPVGAVNRHRYALIIGNEDYSMTGANAEINVPYAVNDAMVFREYCVRTFGVPDNQIKVVPNATAGMMHEQLDWLVNMASTDPEAELIFYYSGHGNNDEATKEPYLLPVDITGKNIRLGISLTELYRELATYPVKGAYVFLDACFSGGYKSAAPLLAQKGVRVVPKVGLPQGKTLSFSSSSGDQTSSVYHDKKQGYYTYFLIKTIKDARGDLSMKDLFERTSAAVKKATAMIGKMQEPQCMVSPTWFGWESLRLETPVEPAPVAPQGE
ncbi:caspase family protein [Bacteroides salyersiae]|uniref:caspase family protein n=1 Tax=Bacteroides salyersiae TaxID=291644 RepID=UPI001CCF8F3E|nr:caspase family protein [Bacteroides salyersiae]UBD16205.1 caspase family protein [Bacteroides salyersiae]